MLFWHHLARTVTHKSVRETQEMIDSREFTEWRAAYKIKPWGDDWAQADLIAWMVHTAAGGKRLEVGHFLPRGFPVGVRSDEKIWPSAEVLAARMRQYERSLEAVDNGRVDR